MLFIRIGSIMILAVLISVIVGFTQPCYARWESIIQNQKEAHRNNTLIKIADPQIKAIKIIENTEPLVDLEQAHHPRILFMPRKEEVSPGSHFYRAPHPEFAKVRLGLFEALKIMLSHLPNHIGLYVYEAYRPLSVQKQYFDKVFNEIRIAKPLLSEEEVFGETAILVSPIENNVPPHSTGGAIDLTLIDLETGIPLPMGQFGALNGPNPVAQTFTTIGLTEEEVSHRKLLWEAAGKAGLVNYPFEWWHFSIGDRYWAFYLGLNSCTYGGL